jgi:hypothetical protein
MTVTYYHYTTAQAIESILKDGTLWLTRGDFLNDKTEVHYATNLVRRILKETNFEKIQVEKCLKKAEADLAKTYILSLSENPDSLTLWSRYAKNDGYNLGINTQELQDYINKGEMGILSKNTIC